MDTPQRDLEAIRHLLADLTRRVARIEQQLAINSESPVTHAANATSPPAEPSQTPTPVQPPRPTSSAEVPHVASPPPIFATSVPRAPRVDAPDLESRIGSQWLNRIGIAAVLIGVSYFLKFAFENNWIGPAGRVTIGILAGIAVVLWSERFRSHGFKVFSYSLKAVGIGTLYLSLWAAFQAYRLIPGGVAFAMMLAITAATAFMALAQDAQILAAFALTGAFSTPILLSTGVNHELALFAYVTILDAATLLLVIFRPWRRLLVMSYAGTLLLYVGWYSAYYSRSELGLTLGFATLFFAIFAIAPLVSLQPQSEAPLFASIPALLAVINAGAYFLQSYVMIEEVDKTYMAWFALALAAVYIFLSRQVHSRKLNSATAQLLHFLHLAVAVGFITVAIPIRLDAHWITIGWFVEAAVLLWIANRINSYFLSALALLAIALGLVRLLVFDNFQTTQLIFNMRMLTYAIAVAVLGSLAWFASQRAEETPQQIARIALVALNLLALIALSREITDYYARQMVTYRPTMRAQWQTYYADNRRIQIARDFTYSALWMAYGAMLMVIGFVRRSAFVRWQALLLIAITIAKVFVYDVSELDRGYRIVSFIVLGALLLAISFVYQRDWLKLSNRNQPGTTPHS